MSWPRRSSPTGSGASNPGRKAFRELRARYEDFTGADHNELIAIAAWAAYYGDSELALAAAADSTRRRTQNVWFVWLPLFDEMRAQPGFEQLVTELGLVEYWREYGWPPFCRPLGAAGAECA